MWVLFVLFRRRVEQLQVYVAPDAVLLVEREVDEVIVGVRRVAVIVTVGMNRVVAAQQLDVRIRRDDVQRHVDEVVILNPPVHIRFLLH